MKINIFFVGPPKSWCLHVCLSVCLPACLSPQYSTKSVVLYFYFRKRKKWKLKILNALIRICVCVWARFSDLYGSETKCKMCVWFRIRMHGIDYTSTNSERRHSFIDLTTDIRAFLLFRIWFTVTNKQLQQIYTFLCLPSSVCSFVCSF